MKPKTPFNAFFILFILSGLSTFPQQKLDLPYNYLWHLTKKEYAHYIRKSQLNVNELKFDGKVADYNNAGHLLMEGYFKNNMRNGFFKFYFSDGRLKCEGNYKNNLRDSIWNFYNERGELYQVVDFTNKDFIVHKYINEDGKNMVQNGTGKWTTTFENEYTKEIDGMIYIIRENIVVQGRLKDYKRVGSWNIERLEDRKVLQSLLYKNGAVINHPDYRYPEFPEMDKYKLETTTSFIIDDNVFNKNIRYFSSDKFLSIITGEDVKVKNRTACYAFGKPELERLIKSKIKYPKECQEKGIEETIYIKVQIDENGNASEHSVYIGENKMLRKEAIRVIDSINNWIPAIKNYRKSKSIIVVPVEFKL